MVKRYKQYSDVLKDTFGCKVYKVTLDAGFNCPNRDGTISYGGCIFCDDSGSFSQSHDNCCSIEQQLINGIEKIPKRLKPEKYISYFQAFTNTYGTVDELDKIYKAALSHKDVVGLSIGTRPDCVDAEKIAMIEKIAKDKYVWVEYGLQSIHDRTLDFINRGHNSQVFVDAVKLTQGRNINICAHVILGLPNETKDDMLQTIKTLADLKIDGVKFHQLCALKGTKLEEIYNQGKFTPMEADEYVSMICDCLEILPPTTSIHRLAGNGLTSLLVAPKWLPQKFRVLNMIDDELERRDSYQGKYYKP